MRLKCPISLTVLGSLLFFSTAAQADRWAWRAYPNGPKGQLSVGFETALSHLLVQPAPGIDARRISLEVADLAKMTTPGAARRIVHDRVVVEVSGLDADRLRELADGLISRGVALDVWPALARATGVGFTDDLLAVRFHGPVVPDHLEKAGVELLGATRLPGVYRGRAVDGDALRAAFALLELPETAWAEPDLIRDVKPLGLPDDPLLGRQWHLEADDNVGDINANAAWAISTGTPETHIAIFDTGVDLEHPDLVPNLVQGFDAAGGDNDPSAGCSSSPDGAGPAGECPNDQPYRESHGTAVSGLSAARGGNSLFGTGVCPDCSIYPVRIIADQGFRSLSTAEAFRRAGEEGVSVINNSWGPNLTRFFPLSEAEREAFGFVTREARDGLGIPVLFAAGNDFFTQANANPYAAYPDVITVAASTRIDDFACYSDYGTVISIAAPSQGCYDGESGIATTDVQGGEGYSGGDFTEGFGGTSAACPIAAGLAGLILSVNPGLTAQQVKLIMQMSAAKIRADKNPWEQLVGTDLAAAFDYDEHGFSLGFGYGRIDAGAALAIARDMPPMATAACGEGCPRCFEDRCAPDCETDADCPGATRCQMLPENVTACVLPRPGPTDVGEPCTAECEVCVRSIDSQFNEINMCTKRCPGGDDECPFGLDCRRLNNNEAAVCIPGNAECGANWNDVRCQSNVQVSGGGQEYCSCECIPGTPGACPDAFICSEVQCEQIGRQTVSCQATNGRGNYLPMCVPDPNFRRPCERHAQCGGAMFCIDGTCAPDQAPGGCDACIACGEDGDCNDGEVCVSVPSRGPHCLKVCDGQADCVGTTICSDIPGPGPSYCINDNFQAKGICPSSWRCEVEGRCFADGDCADGVSCDSNLCGGQAPDAEVVADAAAPDAGPPADARPVAPADVELPPEVDEDKTPEPIEDAAVDDPDSLATGEEKKTAGGGCQMGLSPTPPALFALPLALLALRRTRRKLR